jgi:hypothetical protein
VASSGDGIDPTRAPGARDAWDPNATSHRGRCLRAMLPETRLEQYLVVSRSPLAYSSSGLLPGWMDKAARCRNPASPHIIRGWRSGDVVRHPVWFILSWGSYVQPLEAGSLIRGVWAPAMYRCGKPIVSGILGHNRWPAVTGVMTPIVVFGGGGS